MFKFLVVNAHMHAPNYTPSIWKKPTANSVGGGTGHKDCHCLLKGRQYRYLGRCPGFSPGEPKTGFVTPMLCTGPSFRRSPGSGVLLVAHVLSWGPGSLARGEEINTENRCQACCLFDLKQMASFAFLSFRK